MLTPEQIKNLKEGDPIVIHTTIECLDSDGEARFSTPNICGGDSHAYIDLKYVSLPSNSQSSIVNRQSKYDPTRLFKRGDKVKRRTVDGRTDPDVLEDIYLAVTTDEDKYGNVRVQEPNGRSIVTKSVFLELITPVEEREPYCVRFVNDQGSEEWHVELRNNSLAFVAVYVMCVK